MRWQWHLLFKLRELTRLIVFCGHKDKIQTFLWLAVLYTLNATCLFDHTLYLEHPRSSFSLLLEYTKLKTLKKTQTKPTQNLIHQSLAFKSCCGILGGFCHSGPKSDWREVFRVACCYHVPLSHALPLSPLPYVVICVPSKFRAVTKLSHFLAEFCIPQRL